MRIKRRRASIKTTSPDLTEGQFLVYPSTFTRTPDSYGDVVAKGAFTDTIAAWLSSEKTLPGLYGHRMDDPDYYVASAIDMGEDDYGWWITGQFDMDSPKGPQVYRLVKDGRLNELSFAFDVLDEGRVKLDDGREVNELRKLDVHEFSFVPLGANRDTRVVEIKAPSLARAEHVLQQAKAGRVLSKKNEDELRSAYEAIGRVLAEIAPSDSEDPGEEPPKARLAHLRSAIITAEIGTEAALRGAN